MPSAHQTPSTTCNLGLNFAKVLAAAAASSPYPKRDRLVTLLGKDTPIPGCSLRVRAAASSSDSLGRVAPASGPGDLSRDASLLSGSPDSLPGLPPCKQVKSRVQATRLKSKIKAWPLLCS
jgi:hypothetical protein